MPPRRVPGIAGYPSDNRHLVLAERNSVFCLPPTVTFIETFDALRARPHQREDVH